MNYNEVEIRNDDELSALVAKAMVSVVATMALLVMATVLAFSWSGGIA
jgi:hypothetical protein